MRKLWMVLGLVGAVAVLVGGVVISRQTPKAGVAIIGDQTPKLLELTGLKQTLPLHTAAITVVSVEDWTRLRYIADMHALCGAACADPAGAVRVLRLRPGGSDVVLYLNHEMLGVTEDLPCLAGIILAEPQGSVTDDGLPECAGSGEVLSLWSVPGLGTF